MRIALASDWFAPRRGGIEGQLLQLAERLGVRGHIVSVLTSTPGARSGDAYDVRPLDVMTLPRLQLAVSPTLISVLRGELQRGYDLVHAHVSVVSPVGYVAAAVARSVGLPTVLTFHSVLRLKAFLLSTVNAAADLAASATVWTAVSELVASQARRALSGADVTVLPNGIDLPFWQGARGRSRRTRSDEVTLVSTMRLHRKKRPMQLVRAFARAMSRSRTAARLIIIGDGPERTALEREIRDFGLHEGNARIELLGWLDPESVRPVYGDADGFVLASTRESFGIAALEARAAGLPVIAMASGSSDFLRDDGNALICVDDAELTGAIARFIADPDLRTRLAAGTAAQSAELERYDWSAVLTLHETTYQRAMKRAALAAGAVAASV